MPIPKFTKSPLIEVVCGIEFNALDFSSVHFGLYWEAIKDRFPIPPLDRPPIGDIEIFNTMPLLRRVWFESDDRKQLIQLQSNRFHYNWRKRDDSGPYPHFHEIYPRFYDEWSKLQSWWSQIEGTPLQPIRYELTYVNQIDKNFGWNNASDHHKIFSIVSQEWQNIPLQSNVFNTNIEFRLPDEKGTLCVDLKQGVRPKDSMVLMILDLTASTTDMTIDINNWFDLAHASAVEMFLSLINQQCKEEWGLKWLA